MEKIIITNEELKELEVFNKGFESTIYKKDEDTLLKVFYEINDKIIEKIKYFNDLNLKCTCNPKELIVVDGDIQGYSMTNMKGFQPISKYKSLPIIRRIELLEKLSIILESIHNCGIVFGDLNINNILSDGTNIYLTDIVNAKIDKSLIMDKDKEFFDFNEVSSTMYFYKQEDGEMDYNLDNYMLNLLTIYLLNDNIRYEDVNKVIFNTLVNIFNNKDYQEIIGLTDNDKCKDIGYQMINPEKGVDKLFIDYIDKDYYNDTEIHKQIK